MNCNKESDSIRTNEASTRNDHGKSSSSYFALKDLEEITVTSNLLAFHYLFDKNILHLNLECK